MLSVDFLFSFALFSVFHPFAYSFLSNSERILTEKSVSIYFLIYACVTIQRFGAALLCCVIGWYPLGLFLSMCDVKY